MPGPRAQFSKFEWARGREGGGECRGGVESVESSVKEMGKVERNERSGEVTEKKNC